MITRIGLFAGDILNYLDGKDEAVSFTDVVSSLGAESLRELVLMSVGWLAREGHIALEGTTLDFKIRLKGNGR